MIIYKKLMPKIRGNKKVQIIDIYKLYFDFIIKNTQMYSSSRRRGSLN